jgi:hypothetical protein
MAELQLPKNSRVTEGKLWPKPVQRLLFGAMAGSCYPDGGETGLTRHD